MQSWRALIVAHRSDPRIQRKLSLRTKQGYHRITDDILEKNADKAVAETTRQHVRAIHTKLSPTPRKADGVVQVISLLWNYAKKHLDWPLGENPAANIELYGKSREFETWPEWLINALPKAPHAVQVAAECILGSGQRPSAAILMRHDDFEGDDMWVRDEKGKERFKVYCPDRLRIFVASIRKTGAYLLPKNLTEPLGYSAVEKQFRTWRKTLGDAARPYSLHGLRKLAIIQLAEAGCSDAEIQAVTNQSLAMVAYYRQKADRTKLSKAAQIRRDQNRNET